MNTREVAMTLSQMVRQKQSQGYAVRSDKVPDYDALLLQELSRLENFSAEYVEELKCLSKCIRKFLWKDNAVSLYAMLNTLNEFSGIIAEIITPEVYWNLDTIMEYINHLSFHGNEFGVADPLIFDEIRDRVQSAGAEPVVSKQWADILSADDGRKSFIDVFDDIFQNAIEKYEGDFIRSLNDEDVLCRMVEETICNEERFIPWSNKVQNRWNPPGKTYLYLSYDQEEKAYNADLTLNEYICLLECRTEPGKDTCFCKFRPTKGGRILDLSYNDVRLSDIRRKLADQMNAHTQSITDKLLADPELFAHIEDKKYVEKRIQNAMAANPIEKEIVAKNIARQLLKLICNCIYKKVDEHEESAKEKAYKSFHILAEYLESKGITGIIYPCTRTNKVIGKNVVLFDINDAEPIKGSIKRYHYCG